MSDTSPVEVKGKGAQGSNAKQTKMLIVLGVVFVLLLVIQLPKLLSAGSSDVPAPTAAPVPVPVPVAGAVSVTPPVAATPSAERTPPPPRPRRNPFDPPR